MKLKGRRQHRWVSTGLFEFEAAEASSGSWPHQLAQDATEEDNTNMITEAPEGHTSAMDHFPVCNRGYRGVRHRQRWEGCLIHLHIAPGDLRARHREKYQVRAGINQTERGNGQAAIQQIQALSQSLCRPAKAGSSGGATRQAAEPVSAAP